MRCRQFFIPTDLVYLVCKSVIYNINGFVEAQDDDKLQRKHDGVMESWLGNQVSNTTQMNCFIIWFNVNKLSAIRDYILWPSQEECGLGCLHEPFTKNTVSMSF